MPPVQIDRFENIEKTKAVSFEEIYNTVQHSKSVTVTDYAALRAYTGTAEIAIITDEGISGTFKRANSSVIEDNDGTVIFNGSGHLWLRLTDQTVNIRWFGAKGDNVTDDSDAIMAAINCVNRLEGHKKLIIPSGTFLTSKTCQPSSNVTIEFTGWLKCLARPNNELDTLLVPAIGASNVFFINPQIDLNYIPAMNGFIFRTGNSNCHTVGGHVKNGVHAKGLTQGGRGFNLESNKTKFNNANCTITGLRITNCYMGFAVQGGEQNNRNNFIIDSINIDECDVAFWLTGNTPGYPHSCEEMQGIISNITWRNCGVNTQYRNQGGAIVMDRASNILMTNIAGHTSSDYGVIDTVVQGNCSKVMFVGVFIGEAKNAISFSPYKESDSIVPYEHSVQDTDITLDIHGTVEDFIKNTHLPPPPAAINSENYILRSRVRGSATVIKTKRAVNTNITSFSSLKIDLLERTSNAQIAGPANAVLSTLFTSFPGRKIDMDLTQVGTLQSNGDISSYAPSPSFTLYDASNHSKNFRLSASNSIFSITTDTLQSPGQFNQTIYKHDESNESGHFMINGTPVFSYNKAGPTIGLFTPDSTNPKTGYISMQDTSGILRKIPVIE